MDFVRLLILLLPVAQIKVIDTHFRQVHRLESNHFVPFDWGVIPGIRTRLKCVILTLKISTRAMRQALLTVARG